VQQNNIYNWAVRIMMNLMQASTPDHSRLAAGETA
jgi:hypothetical protein